MSTESRDLLTRIDRLEQHNRSLKRWGAGLALGLGLLGLASAKLVCDVVTGERLVIHDTAGRTRVMVDAYGTDTPSLVFNNREGRAVAKLGVDEKTGEFVVNVLDSKGGVKANWRLGNEAPKTEEPLPEKKPAGPVVMAR